jgi:hypothetical protein
MGDASKCGPITYPGFTKNKVDQTLQEIKDLNKSEKDPNKQSTVTPTGTNSWDMDTKKHGVQLHGSWDPSTEQLTVTITHMGALVGCNDVYNALDQVIGQKGARPAHAACSTCSGSGSNYASLQEGAFPDEPSGS